MVRGAFTWTRQWWYIQVWLQSWFHQDWRSVEGQKLSVVGLPRKCQNHGKPIPFMKKMPTEKEK